MLLQPEGLLFHLSTGESVPLWPDMISVQLSGEAAGAIDPEAVRESVAAVFHYFKHELGRHSVSVGEFSRALKKALCRVGLASALTEALACAPPAFECDLRRLAQQSDKGFELLFFPRLRDEMNKQLRQPVRVIRFHGLRGCVKQLAGARRWGAHCRTLRDQIVAYLRACICTDNEGKDCTLVVE
jgi:hypothetical protein